MSSAIGRKAVANKKLRDSGKLTEEHKDWRIIKVDNGVYTLFKDGVEVKIDISAD